MNPAQILRYCDRQYVSELLTLYRANWFIDTVDEKPRPLPVAEYSALLMNVIQGKCYTPSEYGAILDESGFVVGTYQNTIADRGFMATVKR